MNTYLAVAEMRQTVGTEREFSLKFRKWNMQTGAGGDLTYIARARCRKAARQACDGGAADDGTTPIANAEHKLFFTDLDTGRDMVCWQPLIVEYNGERVTLE